MFKDTINYIYSVILTTFISFMQLPIVHKVKFLTNQLYICDYTKEDFESIWKIKCLKIVDNHIYGYVIDITTPLKKIKENCVYTLTDGIHTVYFPVFKTEIQKLSNNKTDISLYDILRYRIDTQISDLDLTIDTKYNNLFGSDYQYFLPYFIDNDYINILNNMYIYSMIF